MNPQNSHAAPCRVLPGLSQGGCGGRTEANTHTTQQVRAESVGPSHHPTHFRITRPLADRPPGR
eukprot:scaffold116036_cov69-Phaeocystis_antarctica.AAC.1